MASLISFALGGAHQGWPNEPVLYRIRVLGHGTPDSNRGHLIRYLTAPNPPKGASGIPDDKGELLAFDAVPAGDWNLGRLIISSAGDEFVLASTELSQLEETVGLLDAGPAWCDTKADLVDLLDALYAHRESAWLDDSLDNVTDIQCMDHLSAVIFPAPAAFAATALGPEVIGVWAWQPGNAHGIAGESDVYSAIQARDPGLAPRFLAHITDNKTRIIGFLLERVAGAREAEPADLDKCRATLSRLHALGIAYGRPKRHSFLVRGDGTVLLQGFGGSFRTTDKEILDRELEGLEQVLAEHPSELEKHNAPIDMKLSDITLLGSQSHGLTHPIMH
ncbi:hypothetical protein EKO27_g9558 [Xylaria grammica]|uniref:Aminoglycoside phosphotransferase domain-containing protein n=1 Tax=Xylaria grammica TaxID=363999 RepID=A0A439CTQ0_9PEZI|nr:hypothetical protein EKO27_g9558 [Xylaria grammica]